MRDDGKRMRALLGSCLLLVLTGAFAGCSSNNSTTAAPGGPGGTLGILTPLTPLAADAGGHSSGFNIAASAGMALPSPAVSPVPAATGGTIIDNDAAIRLGKALFWDVQVGSDGQIACASCHFSAGADSRAFNTVHPGPDALFDPLVVAGPGANYPGLTFDAGLVNDVVGSSGVLSMAFGSISDNVADAGVDNCASVAPADNAQLTFFNAGQRLVTGRNTPPAVGAVYYLDNFWDGRASRNFNGLSPLGLVDGPTVAGINSLASQAVGPPLSDVEMSCAGRGWNGPNSIGAKMVLRTPLAKQLVDPGDSVLGELSNAPENGLDCGHPGRLCTYADLIADAFGPAPIQTYIDNFSGIWGQAVAAYEATLVPNRTPYDLGLLTPAQVNGLNAMRAGDGNSSCMICHVEPEFSDATVRHINANGGPGIPKAPGGDKGFHNIGASPTASDRGRATSPGGVYNASPFNEGAFKTPGLRNLALTAPYMHNGSVATIPDVVNFYNGNGQIVANPGFNPAAEVNVADDVDVEDFLLNGLLDCRVANEKAPFDHPSLVIPNGPLGNPLTLPAVGAAGINSAVICP